MKTKLLRRARGRLRYKYRILRRGKNKLTQEVHQIWWDNTAGVPHWHSTSKEKFYESYRSDLRYEAYQIFGEDRTYKITYL